MVKETPPTPTAAPTTASTPSSSPTEAVVEPNDSKYPLWKQVKDAMATYDFTDADVLAFAKDQGIISARNRMPLNDLPDSAFAMIVAKLPALIAKFTTEAAP